MSGHFSPIFVDVTGMLEISIKLQKINHCTHLPYWSHDQYFSGKNEDGFMSYMSLTVGSKWHK